ADALEAVVGAHAELELFDREVLHPVHDRSLGDVLWSRLAEALDCVQVGEDGELADEDLGRLADRVTRLDRAVGRDVEDELVVVGALTDARRLDLVRDTPHRREDGVDRDDADGGLRPAVELGGDVAAAAADRQGHLELALVAELRELEVLVQDLEVGGSLNVGGGDRAGTLLRDVHLDLGRLAVEEADQVLEIENDVGDVLTHARERGELVRDALDLDG